jgi:hypothetical protein
MSNRSTGSNIDGVRNAALDQIDRARKKFLLALIGAAAWEAWFLVAFFLAMELGNRLHVLLLIATVGSYTVVVLGLVALGAYLNRSNLRMLKAIELMKDEIVEELSKRK